MWRNVFNWKLLRNLVLLLLSFFFLGDQNSVEAKKSRAHKEISITFDELPVARSFDEVDKAVLTTRILEVLKKHKVKAAGFVVSENIGNSFDLLGQWLNAGHVLGSLTYSHQDLNEIGAKQFIKDIASGSEALEPMLTGFGQKKRYFRYPFLHYGGTVEDKRQVKLYLDEHDIIVAHATVVVEDYLYNLSLEKISRRPDSTKYDALRYEYISHVLDQVERCEEMATQVLKCPCRQILQLRANRLNALFLDALLTALEDMGYKFVSLDYAMRDKLYSADEAYYGLRGVGYLDMIKLSNPDLLPAE